VCRHFAVLATSRTFIFLQILYCSCRQFARTSKQRKSLAVRATAHGNACLDGLSYCILWYFFIGSAFSMPPPYLFRKGCTNASTYCTCVHARHASTYCTNASMYVMRPCTSCVHLLYKCVHVRHASIYCTNASMYVMRPLAVQMRPLVVHDQGLPPLPPKSDERKAKSQAATPGQWCGVLHT